MSNNGSDEFQRQVLEMLRTQQEAYLDAVRAWQDAMSAGGSAPPWPEPPPLDTLPQATEFAEASAAFTARLLKEQSRFMKRLSETLAAANKKR